MQRRVFVYGTLLRGEVNHHLLNGACLLGAYRTPPRYTLFLLGAYPGLARRGHCRVAGEVYAVDRACLRRLDRLEDYPHLYDRQPMQTPFGSAWVYVYRGSLEGRSVIRAGDWRAFASDSGSLRAAGVRAARDPKTYCFGRAV